MDREKDDKKQASWIKKNAFAVSAVSALVVISAVCAFRVYKITAKEEAEEKEELERKEVEEREDAERKRAEEKEELENAYFLHVTKWVGIYNKPGVQGNVRLTKRGHVVTMELPRILGPCVATEQMWMVESLPERFRPTQDQAVHAAIVQTAEGTRTDGSINVGVGGNVQVWRGTLPFGPFSATGTPICGLAFPLTVTWTTAN